MRQSQTSLNNTFEKHDKRPVDRSEECQSLSGMDTTKACQGFQWVNGRPTRFKRPQEQTVPGQKHGYADQEKQKKHEIADRAEESAKLQEACRKMANLGVPFVDREYLKVIADASELVHK